MGSGIDAVIFTDGAARPNPGFGGWGVVIMHISSIEYYNVPDMESDKSPIHSLKFLEHKYVAHIPIPKDWELQEKPVDNAVQIHLADKITDLWGSVEKKTKSNACELIAVTKALDYAIKNNFKNIVILSDSIYTVNGTKKLQELKSLPDTGKTIVNKKLWIALNKKLLKLSKSGCDITISWIKGHSVSTGNSIADLNATRGMAAATNGVSIDHCSTALVGKNRPEPPAMHGMLMDTSWYFIPSANEKIRNHYIYITGDHGKPSNKNKEFDWIGKDRSESTLSVTALKESSIYLEPIRKKHREVVPRQDSICVGRLRDIGFKKIRQEIDTHGCDYIYKPANTLGLMSIDGSSITSVVNPPMLGYRLMSQADTNIELLLRIIEKKLPNDFPLIEITDYIYDISGKKITPHKKYSSTEKSLTLSLNELNGTNITLTLGLDLPSRNTLARIAGQDTKVYILLCPQSNTSYRYYVYIKSNEDHMLTSTYRANLAVIS